MAGEQLWITSLSLKIRKFRNKMPGRQPDKPGKVSARNDTVLQ